MKNKYKRFFLLTSFACGMAMLIPVIISSGFVTEGSLDLYYVALLAFLFCHLIVVGELACQAIRMESLKKQLSLVEEENV